MSRDRQRSYRAARWAEIAAAWRLRLAGYAVLAHGFTVGRGSGAGEVDLIVRRGRTVAFVEVKLRPTLAEAAAAIQPRQRARITRAAQAFLAAHPELAGCTARFDAVLVAPWRLPNHLCDAWRMEA